MIARYAWLHKEELLLSTPKQKDIQELGRLLVTREQLVRYRTRKMSSLYEMKNILSSPLTDYCCTILTKIIHYLSKQIKTLEHCIKSLLEREESLHKNFELLDTLKGVGLILASQIIYHTSSKTSDIRQLGTRS